MADAFIVFNELSSGHARSIPEANSQLDGLAGLLLDQTIKVRKIFVGPDGFYGLQVSPGYPVGRWLSSYSASDNERRLRIKAFFDRRVSYDVCAGPENFGVEFSLGTDSPVGLSAAYRSDGLAVSLLSAGCWDTETVRVRMSALEGEDDIVARDCDVTHASRLEHIASHSDWLLRILPSRPDCGPDLWNRRGSLFPKLLFCGCVEPQLERLGGDGPDLRKVDRGLVELQRYCESWRSGGFDIHALGNASGESSSTMQMYSAERTFICPGGESRVFEWHLKRGDLRIYFRAEAADRAILVGYIGKHLRTANF